METVIFFLALSTLPQLAEPQVTAKTSYRASVEVVSGDSRIFSGEDVRLRCSAPDTHGFRWSYRWFKGSEELQVHGPDLILWRARVHDSGKFYCEGVRDTVVGQTHTLQSLPAEIFVDGGWAMTSVTPNSALVGHNLEVECRVRGKRPLSEVIFYRDGVEVSRQQGNAPRLLLSNLTTKDQGMYSCRASWNTRGQTHSVISSDTLGRVLEVLSKPDLEISVLNNQSPDRMKLICHHEYNLPAPAPAAHVYFYRNNKRLGTATSESHLSVRKSSGVYRCKVRVPSLNLIRWSEPKGFGQEAGLQVQVPSVLTPRPQTPHLNLDPPVRPSPRQPLATTPVLVYHRGAASPRWSVDPSEASTLPSTVQHLTSTPAPGSDSGHEGSGDAFEGSGDFVDDDDDSP